MACLVKSSEWQIVFVPSGHLNLDEEQIMSELETRLPQLMERVDIIRGRL